MNTHRTSRRDFVATLLAAACGFAVAGCDETQRAADAGAAGAQPSIKPAQFFPSAEQTLQADATPAVQYLVQVLAWKIALPAGAVSRNDEFWKHVQETAVDVPTYELLYKNGVRVGVAPSSEWAYLKGVLDQNPAVSQSSTYTGREAKDLDTEMKLRVAYQNLFYYDPSGELVGRTHERCDNLLRLSFQPAPRKPGTVRLTLCPVIRSLRQRIVAVGDINTRQIEEFYPEQLYDLNLTVDVPLDDFLVVGPSAEAKWPTSLGSNFLVNDASAQQSETLLIFKPVVFGEKPPTTITQTAASQPSDVKKP
jgi:hypothetical protein